MEGKKKQTNCWYAKSSLKIPNPCANQDFLFFPNFCDMKDLAKFTLEKLKVIITWEVSTSPTLL
jgi:hypothetical protein